MPDPQDVAYAYLLGGDTPAVQDVLRTVGAAVGAPGLLSRLFEANLGDPVGPGQQANVGAAVSRLTVPDLAIACTFTVSVEDVRCTFDGTPPTTLVGLLIAAGSTVTLTGRPTMQGMLIIGAAAGATIDVTYWT